MIHARSFPLLLVALAACAQSPEGLFETPQGDGPRVVFDFDRRPLPEIPFPNDIATRPDPSSPTGLRVNASLVAATELEQTARRRIDELSGFGVYQPISVQFDAPLDLDAIYARHRDYRRPDGRDYDFTNDAVYLIDVTRDSPDFGKPVPLDFGEGNFPVLLRTPTQYWEHDPKTITAALAFESYEEDLNGNGRLDPGEDLDLDGVLDHPNVYAPEDGNPALDPIRDLVSFYEFETNTLVFKPVLPLREKSTYAVVLTNRLLGADGEPVRSPFEYVNHAAQTDDLRPVVDALAEFDLGADDIAFAWTYTTQEAAGQLVTLRDGLYGEGPLAWLDEDFPPEMTKLFTMVEADPTAPDEPPPTNPYILPSERLKKVLGPFAMLAFASFGISDTDQLVVTHDFYAYHVSGKFRAPRLLDLVDEGTLDARAWPENLRDPSLRDRIDSHEVQFWCAIPKKEYKRDPDKPAPVVLYAHGYTSNKLEQLGLALHAKFGIAGCSIDAVLHGVSLPEDSKSAASALLNIYGMGPAFEALAENRMEDMDGDGTLDVGGEFFSGYMFRTRDNLRQTLLDWMTLVRLIRSFGSTNMLDVDGDGKPELLGDFDADGMIDIGGDDATFFASGTSLGGLLSAMLSAVEAKVVAGAPIAGGAGLVDLSSRSEQGGVVEALMLRMMGPLFVGEPTGNGDVRIYELFPNGNIDTRYDVAYRAGIEPGDTVRVTNLDTGAARCTRVMPMMPPPGYENYEGWAGASNCSLNDAGACRTCPEGTEGTYACDLAGTFRLGVAADAGDRVRIDVFAGGDVATIEGDERDCYIDDDAVLRASVDRFDALPIHYRGKDYPQGSPLVALEDGYGFQRGTALLRRFLGIAAIVVEPADPAIFAPHYSRDPFTFREHGKEFTKAPTNVMDVTTIGDPNVPPNTGTSIARIGGFIELEEPDPRWGKTPNRLLIDEGIVTGIPWLEVRGADWGPVLVDVDNLSDSTNVLAQDPAGSVDSLVAPRTQPPARIAVQTPGTTDGKSGIIYPIISEYRGVHGFPPPGLTGLPFDVGQFMEHFIGAYFDSRGTQVRYEPCMAKLAACDWVPVPPSCAADPAAQGCD
ncbi:MAG: hypothetical protein IPH07_39720 [Deltaproteobacteria bacterium]|nr:hypothetical protein [Deltaproteobacteria bacterium]MBK8241028.1 hypothetical protein [Deltaproteobacteria bacterium]MBP7291737.1 hypothetical protein [Nannocystaceae bacterium]